MDTRGNRTSMTPAELDQLSQERDRHAKQKVARLQFRIVDLYEKCLDHLNSWEESFVTSVYNMYEKDQLDRCTDKQANVIYRIWKDMNEKGRVQLPEGGI